MYVGPCLPRGPGMSARLLAVARLSLSCGGHLESEPAEDRFVSVGLSAFHIKTIRHEKPLEIQDVSGLLENGEQPSAPSISSPRIPLHLVPPPPRVCTLLMFRSTQGPWTYLGHRAIHLLREEGRPASLRGNTPLRNAPSCQIKRQPNWPAELQTSYLHVKSHSVKDS